MAAPLSSAPTSPMMLRWVALQLYLTPTHPCTCLALRTEGSTTAWYGFVNWDSGIPVISDQKATAAARSSP